ncbi:conserved hypothetical protein [Azospirillaceae bacterium]
MAKKNITAMPQIRVGKIQKHEFIELTIPGNVATPRIYFADQPNLRNVHTMRIKAYHDEILTKVPSGNTVIDYDLFRTAYITLVLFDGVEFLHECPLAEFQTYWGTRTGAFPFVNMQPSDFNFQKINWTKCYVEFIGLTAKPDARSLPFSYYYTDVASIEKAQAQFEFNENMK